MLTGLLTDLRKDFAIFIWAFCFMAAAAAATREQHSLGDEHQCRCKLAPVVPALASRTTYLALGCRKGVL